MRQPLFLHKKFYFTVTLQVIFFFPEVIVITAFPAFFAVIFPLLVTVATFVLEDL